MALAERARALAKGATMVRQDPAAREAPPDNQDKTEIAKQQAPAGAQAASTPAPEPAADKRPASAALLPSVDWDFG